MCHITQISLESFCCAFVYNRAWRDSRDWLEKETKMFKAYIERFSSQIRDIFHIAPEESDSENNKRTKEQQFASVVLKLRNIMEKRHYVSVIQ